MLSLYTFLWANVLVGALSFGGGKGFIPIYKQVYVEMYQIVDKLKMTEIIAYASALPGPLGPLITGVVGYNLFGFTGLFLGIIFLIFPLVILFFIVSFYYDKHQENPSIKSISKYMNPAIAGLLISVIIGSIDASYSNYYLIYFAITFIISCFLFIKYNMHPIILILISGFISYFIL